MRFHHKVCPLIPKLRMQTHNKRRMYVTPEGKLYPSVTTVMRILSKEGIAEWKKKVGQGAANEVVMRSTTIGSELHKVIEDYLNNKSLNEYKNIIPLAHFNNIKPYVDNINNIMCQEATLYSDDLGIAGRVDCVAEYDHIPSIIDFKTSRKSKKEEWIESYLLQETAYSLMFKFVTGLEYKQIVTIISGEDGSHDVFIRNRTEYEDRLKEVIRDYKQSL